MVKISVVVASKVGAPFLDHCLRSLEHQVRALDAEAIVVTPGPETAAARIMAAFPWTRVVRAPDLSTVPALRRRGVLEATGELVAIIEEHCAADDGWLAEAQAALSQGQDGAVGGAIFDDDYARVRDWVVYFCEYHGSLPPVPTGRTHDLNDANIAYRRRLLLEHADLLDRGYWPMTLHPTLRAQGVTFLAVPGMVVRHRGPFDFGYYLKQRFWFSRAYAGVRAATQPRSWRAAYLAGAPLVPFLLLARMTRQVLVKRGRRREFARSLPLTMCALVVLVAGEWVGCLLGPGDALAKVE